jgi:hypothetical protein
VYWYTLLGADMRGIRHTLVYLFHDLLVAFKCPWVSFGMVSFGKCAWVFLGVLLVW